MTAFVLIILIERKLRELFIKETMKKLLLESALGLAIANKFTLASVRKSPNAMLFLSSIKVTVILFSFNQIALQFLRVTVVKISSLSVTKSGQSKRTSPESVGELREMAGRVSSPDRHDGVYHHFC